MALCHLWVHLCLSWLLALGQSSEIHPNRLLKTETFLGLPVPDCPSWRCERHCSDHPSRNAERQHGCHCDNMCLLYGDCCYDFFKSCLSLPDEEARELLEKDKVSAYLASYMFNPHPEDEDLRDAAAFLQCSPGHRGSPILDVSGSGLYLISQCPRSWGKDITRDLCEDKSDNLFNSVPVLYEKGNIGFYRNKHCATCHGISEMDMIFWDTLIKCDAKKLRNAIKGKNIQTFIRFLNSGRCNMITIPPAITSDVIQRSCLFFGSSKSNCSIEQPVRSNEMFCDRYTMAVKTETGLVFQNPHCAHACMGSNVSLGCHEVSTGMVSKKETDRYETNETLSIRFFSNGNAIYPMAKTRGDILNFPGIHCGNHRVFDPFRETCISTKCLPGWHAAQRECMPNRTVPILPDSYLFPEGTQSLLLEATFAVESGSTLCEDISKHELFSIILHFLEAPTVDRLFHTCTESSERRIMAEETNRYYISVGVDRDDDHRNTSADNHDEAKTEKNRKRRELIRGNEPTPDMFPVIKGIDQNGPRHNSSNISPELRRKLIDLVGLTSEPQVKYIQVQIKTTKFSLSRIAELPAVLNGLINKLMLNFKDKVSVESVVVANYNDTPPCNGRLVNRQTFKLYDVSESLYGYDNVTHEQIKVDKTAFAISATVGRDGNTDVHLETNVLLCFIDRTDAPKPDCPTLDFIEDKNDFVIVNATLYVKSTKKTYERGKYKPSGFGVYVCSATLNVTNKTGPITRNRGFFNMPYVQYIVVLVCCCVSLACLLGTFVTYVCFSQLRDISGIILMCLTASVFIAQLLYAAGIDQTHIRAICVSIAIALHFLWLSVFSWMNVLTYDIAHKLRITTPDTADKNSKAFKEYCIFAWGVPFLLVGICASLDFAGGSGFQMEYAKDTCWIGSLMASLIGFALPVGLLLLANFALFVCTIYALQAVARVAKLSEKQLQSRKLLIIYFTLTLILGMSWGFAYSATLAKLPEMWYAFALLNALVGIFIVCCFLLNSRVVQLYKNRFDFGNVKPSGNLPPEEFV